MNIFIKARNHLIATGNENALQKVDSALFCLILCDQAGDSIPAIADQMMTGDPRSRWHDKSFSMVIAADSSMALTYEHAWGDGVPNLRYLETIGAHIKYQSRIDDQMKPKMGEIGKKGLTEIEFNIDQHTKVYIKANDR